MKIPIQVKINDEQGLGDELMKEGFVRDRVEEAKHLIRKQFETAVQKIYVYVLGKFPPGIIEVSFIPNAQGKPFRWAARFDVKNSDENRLFFEVGKQLVVFVLKKGVKKPVKGIAIHEVIHSADQKTLLQTLELIDTIKANQIKAGRDAVDNRNAIKALCDTLKVFSHFRNEGVAILGEYMLTRARFGKVIDTLDKFNELYELTMLKSKKWSQGEKGLGSAYDDNLYSSTYDVAPSILVLALAKRGAIENTLAQRVLEGLDTGNYDLSEEEIKTVIKAALSLSISDYIQGVTNLGDKIAPMQPFLEFCGLVQKEWEKNDIRAFTALLNKPTTVALFNKVMKKIMDNVMPEAEIDNRYSTFDTQLYGKSVHRHLKEKVDWLYLAMKNNEDPEKKKIAQWALTYLFNEEDLIHDDIKGIGLVDDETVIDFAMKLLE